jgi:hypothetical protein
MGAQYLWQGAQEGVAVRAQWGTGLTSARAFDLNDEVHLGEACGASRSLGTTALWMIPLWLKTPLLRAWGGTQNLLILGLRCHPQMQGDYHKVF